MRPVASRLALLLGSASLLVLAAASARAAEAELAQAGPDEIPEQVLITGSLIRGEAAVGVPVLNLEPADFAETGALTASDLFRTIPQFNVIPGPVGTQPANAERGTRVNLRQLDTGVAPRSLMMIDGVRYPPQGSQTCQIDPSIIPSVAIARVDLLLDGASATYGSDAIGGVINIILKRGYDGAQTEIGYTTGAGGHQQYQASQLWGRTWDGGNITLGYQWFGVTPTKGNFNSKYTFDHTAWGLDNRTQLASSIPGTLSTGAPANTLTDPNLYPANIGSNCTNCFAIPRGAGADFNPINNGVGPTAPFSASTLNWATFNTPGNRGTNGTRNEFNPYAITSYSSGLEYNGAFVTVDQRLTRDISFYGEAFYGMRRANYINNQTPLGNQQLSVAVPTFNPYYPAGGAPGNLRVNYHFGIEAPSVYKTWARGMRYLGGLNVALSRGWEAQLFYSQTQDNETVPFFGVRATQVSAALGWTMPITPASGTAPAIGTWTKPASVPYLNLFCDPTVFRCNADATLSYIESLNQVYEYFSINEKGIKADGPLFDLPGGEVKAAIGANFSSSHYLVQTIQTNANNPTLSILSDPESRGVWAVFGQVNVPIIGEANALPMVRRLELETSWRHDQYGDFGGTSNPRIGLNWGISEEWGLTVRGSYGESFRAPNFQENGTAPSLSIAAVGVPADIFNNTNQVVITCDASGRPAAGSGAEKLFNAGFGCNAPTAGLGVGGGARGIVDLGMRTYANTDQQHLGPERSTNWSLGFEFVPRRFLYGLTVEATWYSIKINGILRSVAGGATTPFNDSGLGFGYLVPSDLKDPDTGVQLCPGMDAKPTLCAPFQKIVAAALAQPTNAVRPDAQTLIYFINDSGVMNKGWQKNTGIDWSASYDWDLGDIGGWNTGIIGTYYLGQESVLVPGAQGPQGAVIDALYHTTVNAGRGLVINGVALRPRMKYRARLGWTKGPWSVTAFMDYEAHFFHTQLSPPNVNSNCLSAGGTIGGGTFPCLIDNYTNVEPSYYTFDLSAGYDTGETPANDYLRNIGIQLVVQNVADRHSPYEYRISAGGGNPCACDIIKSLYGRRVQLRLIKTW